MSTSIPRVGRQTIVYDTAPPEQNRSTPKNPESTSGWLLSVGGSIVSGLRTSASAVLSATVFRGTQIIADEDTVDDIGSLTDASEVHDSKLETVLATAQEGEGQDTISSALGETFLEWTDSHVFPAAEQAVARAASDILKQAPQAMELEQAFASVCCMDMGEAADAVTIGAVEQMLETRHRDDRNDNEATRAMLNGEAPNTAEITASVNQALAGLIEQGLSNLPEARDLA